MELNNSQDITVYDGRPEDCSQRIEREIAVYDFLDKLNIKYKRADHSAAENMEQCAAIGEGLGVAISKNVFLCNSQKTKFYLLVMPADKHYYTKVFSKLIGSARLSFAPAEHMEKLLGTTPGSASVMGLINDGESNVELYIDSDVLKDEYFGCHPCINTSSIKIKMSDLLDVFLPATGHSYTVVDLPYEA